MEQSGVELESLANLYKVEYDTSDRRKILGYDCYKAHIIMDMETMIPDTLKDSEMIDKMLGDMTMTAYLTKEIEMPMMQLQQFKGLQMEGTPLFMKLDMGLMSFTYEASSVSQEVDEEIFTKPPPGDYKKMSMEDLQKMGMGSGDFGF